MAIENPITKLRQARGWDPVQAGFALGVSKGTVAAVERGHPIRVPRAVLEGFARLGEDAEAIAKAYLVWRAQEAAKLGVQAQANG